MIEVRMITFQLTELCNNRCVYCYMGAPRIGIPRHLAAPDFLRITEVLRREVKPDMISLSGGEPALHPEFPRMVAIAREQFPGVRLHLQTNGRAFRDEKLCRLVWALGVDTITMSLQSHDPELDERADGIPGRFPEVVRALRNLVEAERRWLRPRLAVNITVSELNAHSVADTVEWLAGAGVRTVTANGMSPISAPSAPRALDERSLSGVFAAARRAATRRGVQFANLHSFTLCEYDGRLEGNDHYACGIGRRFVDVDAAGCLVTCLFVQDEDARRVGPILDGRPFAELWADPKMDGIRCGAALPSKCRGCAMLSECGGPCLGRDCAADAGSQIQIGIRPGGVC